MADVQITVSGISLAVGDSLSYTVRNQIGTTITSGTSTTNPFMVTLTPNIYYIEVVYNVGGVACRSNIIRVEIPDNTLCYCPTWELGSYSTSCDGINTISMSVSGGMPDPVCEQRVTWVQNGITNTFTIPKTQTSFTITVNNNSDVNLTIEMFCCESNEWITCYDEVLSVTETCSCSPPTIVSQVVSTNALGQKVMTITISSTNPPPYTIQFYPFIQDPTNYFIETISGNSTSFTMPTAVALSAGKWLTVVSDSCGTVQSNGL